MSHLIVVAGHGLVSAGPRAAGRIPGTVPLRETREPRHCWQRDNEKAQQRVEQVVGIL